MNQAQTARLLAQVTKRWHRHPWPADSGDVWFADLAPYEYDHALAVIERLDDGRLVPPTPGLVVRELQAVLQGPAPGFDDMIDAVWRALSVRVFVKRFYSPTGQISPAATAEAIAIMQDGGAHEAACRFVAANGLTTVWLIPTGEIEPLDEGQDANRRDASRRYRDQVLPDWRRDPRPGLALERACRVAELDADEMLALGQRARAQFAPAPRRPELPAHAEDEGPMVDFDPAEMLRAHRAERAAAVTRQRGAAAARRQAENDEQRAALDELAAHAARRGQEARA